MKPGLKFLTLLTISMLVIPAGLKAQKAGIRLDNQLSSWINVNLADTVRWQGGLRYIPVVSPYWQTGENSKLDAELSFKSWGNLAFSGFNYDSADFSLKPYRLWLRYTLQISRSGPGCRRSTSDQPWYSGPSCGLTRWTSGTPCS